jgi:hypothetical protein
MWWLIRGPWEVVKWIWAGIVLFFYALFGILNVLTWFDAEPTVYNNNNPPRGGKEPPKDGEQSSAVKPS